MFKIFIFLISLIFLLNEAFGQICPLYDNVVCNSNNKLHRCVCAVPAKTENPVPDQSCNQVVDSSDDEFEAVSITFDVKDFEKDEEDEEDDDDHKMHKRVTKKDDKDDDDDDDDSENKDEDSKEDEGDDFNQEKFRQEIAKLLRIEEDRILILRITCVDNNEKLTVQFVVLKEDDGQAKASKGTKTKGGSDDSDDDDDDDKSRHGSKKNEKDDDDDDDDKTKGKKDKSDDDDDDDKKDNSNNDDDSDEEDEFEPYEPDNLMNSRTLVDELNSRRATGTKIADLEVTGVEVVDELLAIEASTDNTLLLFEALAVVFGVILTCFLGCYFTCKKCQKQDEYLDTLQKA